MAGYDFTFECPERYRGDLRTWLRFFYRTAAGEGLEAHYSTRKIGKRRVEAYVTVDGPLPTMQLLDRQIGAKALEHLVLGSHRLARAKHVVGPFIEANREGVQRISDAVYDLTELMRSKGFSAGMAHTALAPHVLKALEVKRPRSPKTRAIQRIVRAVDGYASGQMDGSDVVILSNQGILEWLRAESGLGAAFGGGFPAVVSHAAQQRVITGREGYRLRLFHSTRNAVRYRGRRPSAKTVHAMLELHLDLINRVP